MITDCSVPTSKNLVSAKVVKKIATEKANGDACDRAEHTLSVAMVFVTGLYTVNTFGIWLR